MMLPFLGGAPMAWTTAMVFFQAALLAGYFGAHLIAGAGGAQGNGLNRPAILPVLMLVGLGALALPIGVPAFYPLPPVDRWPVPWLVGFLGLAVGAVIGRRKVAKHFRIAIADADLGFSRDEAQIAAEAALDGFYVLRTNVPAENLRAADAVRAYKSLPAG
jgi:hypothetical protein